MYNSREAQDNISDIVLVQDIKAKRDTHFRETHQEGSDPLKSKSLAAGGALLSLCSVGFYFLFRQISTFVPVLLTTDHRNSVP